jgi:transcriptional regulator with XRE-family HTH domain
MATFSAPCKGQSEENSMSLGGRLKAERERLGLTQPALGELMDASKRAVLDWEKGVSSPTAAALSKLAAAGGDVLFVVTGRHAELQISAPVQVGAPMAPIEQAHPARIHTASEAPPAWLEPAAVKTDTPQMRGSFDNRAGRLPLPADVLRPRGQRAALPLSLSIPVQAEAGGPTSDRDYTVIPQHRRLAAAGLGTAHQARAGEGPADVDLAGDFAFSHDWLRRNLGHTTGQLVAWRVDGNSMADTLLDGETIVIDEGVQAFGAAHIYVFELQGRCFVKRVHPRTDGSLEVISDNPVYAREVIARDRASAVQVLGKMVWPRVR